MCLEPVSQRYKRCARRTVRLSTYPKFSDPIQYYETPTDAIDAQWTGRGYYKKESLTICCSDVTEGFRKSRTVKDTSY
uniref:Uncharacterized protein n=1 Tax=Ditylenchus dipsaci TaxID=166011 RepID=A0A915DSQ8_9BILA